MKNSHIILGAIALTTCLSTLPADGQLGEGFTRIDPPGSTFTVSRGINNHGDMVGTFYDATGLGHGFLRTEDGQFVTIDHPKAQKVNGFGTDARGINSAGEIVGDYCAAAPCDGVSVIKGYRLKGDAPHVYDKEDFKTLETPGHVNSYLEGINSEGDIVGCEHDTDTMGTMHGIVWEDGRVGRFPVSASMHNGVNDLGEIVGFYTDLKTMHAHAYLLGKHGRKQIDFPGAVNTVAWGINNRSQVVGSYTKSDGSRHGFVWSRGMFTSVDIPGGMQTEVFGINFKGDLVGFYLDAKTGHAFLLKAEDERP
jgi:uncharacterized membrane protein